MNVLLYAATVLIWGTTWIAISMQTGTVAPLVSVFSVHVFPHAEAIAQSSTLLLIMRRPRGSATHRVPASKSLRRADECS